MRLRESAPGELANTVGSTSIPVVSPVKSTCGGITALSVEEPAPGNHQHIYDDLIFFQPSKQCIKID